MSVPLSFISIVINFSQRYPDTAFHVQGPKYGNQNLGNMLFQDVSELAASVEY
jgi:hypothetical protein